MPAPLPLSGVMRSAQDAIESVLGVRPVRVSALAGGCVAAVVRADLPDGATVVAKLDPDRPAVLDSEAFMLRYLAEHTDMPVPGVIGRRPGVLVMEFIEGSTGASGDAELHAAGLLADLHAISADRFGFERDTVIGGLPQPNGWFDSWVEFYRVWRLLSMAQVARDAGRLPSATHTRIQRLAERLDEWLLEPAAPSLVHGDVWSGNILSAGGRVTAFLDPAVCYADAEIELAFITLFSTFGRGFFDAYSERRPIRAGFFEARRDLYTLYPLLVHARLFGGHYVDAVDVITRRFIG